MSDQKRTKRSAVFSFVIESLPLSNYLNPIKVPKCSQDCKKCFELGMLCPPCKQQSKTPNPKKDDIDCIKDEDKSCEDSKCNKSLFNNQSLLCNIPIKRRSFNKRDGNLAIDVDNKTPNNCQNAKLFKKRYLINKILGKGIQGAVFSAFDTKNNMKKVAIKFFNANSSDKSIQKREIDVLIDLKEIENAEGFPKIFDSCTK